MDYGSGHNPRAFRPIFDLINKSCLFEYHARVQSQRDVDMALKYTNPYNLFHRVNRKDCKSCCAIILKYTI